MRLSSLMGMALGLMMLAVQAALPAQAADKPNCAKSSKRHSVVALVANLLGLPLRVGSI